MSNKNDINHSLLDDFTTNMSSASEKKLMLIYQILYIVLSLIPFSIYRIAENIFENGTYRIQAELQFSLSDMDNFCKVTNELSYKLLAISIMLILSVLIMSFISILKISKFKMEKEDIKKFKKGIIIFFISVDYKNVKGTIPWHIDKYESMVNQSDSNASILYTR